MIKKITEQESHYNHLEEMSALQLVSYMNQEDEKVALAVKKQLVNIAQLVDAIADRMLAGGRLFYIGAGTSGRLGILDASECPPTFGVAFGLVNGLIAGGDSAIRKAVEFAEDDTQQAWLDLTIHAINRNDVVIGIAASGTTPYVIGGLKSCMKNEIFTACITCNPGAPIIEQAKIAVVVEVGPEFVTGSTRMKSGTAQKMVLNMISTAVMIKLGRVKGNRMVDMQLSNDKLVDRGTKMVANETGLAYDEAKKLLLQAGSVRAAVEQYGQA